jgi:hypothetical protein
MMRTILVSFRDFVNARGRLVSATLPSPSKWKSIAVTLTLETVRLNLPGSVIDEPIADFVTAIPHANRDNAPCFCRLRQVECVSGFIRVLGGSHDAEEAVERRVTAACFFSIIDDDIWQLWDSDALHSLHHASCRRASTTSAGSGSQAAAFDRACSGVRIPGHEVIRKWCHKFGQTYANALRHR